jgi:hypothetical protein
MPTATLHPVELDLDGFHRNLRREGTPERVFYFEHGVADNLQKQLHDRCGIWDKISADSPTASWDKLIATHRFLGHEYFRVFPEGARVVAPRREGEWTEQGRGAIASWREFETYAWPDPRNADLSVLDYLLGSGNRVTEYVPVDNYLAMLDEGRRLGQ